MKFTRTANAKWEGTGKEGIGHISMESGALKDAKYAFKTRFDQDAGTNPEELIGAAHAGCFTMQLSFLINEEGKTADHLSTDAAVTFEDGAITKIHLTLSGKVPGLSDEKFKELAEKSKEVCPISKLLDTEITLEIV